ncbi:MAG: DNA cytosine methyltransferase [Egibacteraceae bacterium]
MSGAHAHHQPWDLTDERRAAYRRISQESRTAKLKALRGDGPPPLHPINTPSLDPESLMPRLAVHGLRALSLFSGGGGLDLGFDRAGYTHVASYELLDDAAMTLQKAHPEWEVFGGREGDVTTIDWRRYAGHVDVLHGGPPCQPFSMAGRQRGAKDIRDGFPTFVSAILSVRPLAFVAENVPALGARKFEGYVSSAILAPLEREYTVHRFELCAERFGVPQVRRRIFFVGFRSAYAAAAFVPPQPTHAPFGDPVLGGEPACMGARAALGLGDIGFDGLAPTIRSCLTGPRHTTSVLSSVSAQRRWERLGIWPNGVAPTRERARVFVAKNGHFRLSVEDCAILQGFPESWPFQGATYMALGQIGNAVAPPVAYAVARSVKAALAAS